jgi:hypothetical protein
MQTFPPCGFDERAMVGKRFLEQKRKATAGFQNRKNTDEAVADSVALGQLARGILLIDVRLEILKRSALFFSHRDSVVLHALGVLQQERLDVAEMDMEAIKQFRHLPTRRDGQITAKQHAVKTRQHAMNPTLIFADELLHFSTLLLSWM